MSRYKLTLVMRRRGKRRGRPIPDAANPVQFLNELEKALKLENKYSANLLIAYMDQKPGEVKITARDTTVQTLRFLKYWFQLPSEVFFTSICLLDRFLTIMKVKEKFLACLSISCLYVASDIHKCYINLSKLVYVSQTKCTIKDVERMCHIIRQKLEIESKEQPVTVYNYLNLFLRIFYCAAIRFNLRALSTRMLQKNVLVRRLEVVMTDSFCASERPASIALALIQHELKRFLSIVPSKLFYPIEVINLVTVIVELQYICMLAPKRFITCYANLDNVLRKYDDGEKIRNVQQKKWRFSTSTLCTPKPLDNFCTNLFQICEDV